jgi:aminomethyltransferase
VPADDAATLAKALLADAHVKPAGLGARDTLRLEAGLCLYGHDIDATKTPIEAALAWAIQKVRRPGGARAGHYPGSGVIEQQLAHGPLVKRVGLVGLERVPVREAAPLVDTAGNRIGHVTSGTLSPTLNVPIAMGYLPINHVAPAGLVHAPVRGKPQPMRISPMPFTPHRYHRG